MRRNGHRSTVRARAAIIASLVFLGSAGVLAALAVGAGAFTAAPTSPLAITYVCANNSTGQLFYVTPSCAKSQTSVPVTSTSTQFKACYLVSNGVTRKVSSSTQCSNAPRTKENTLAKVPDDSQSLYFCVSSKDGTMYFHGTSPPSCPTGQFAVVIGPHNRPPVASNDSYSTNEDTLLSVSAPGVLGNDSDPDGNPITAQLVSGPSHASSFTLNSNGSFSYTPTANYNGTDSFTYKDSDGITTGNTATVNLTINAVNDPPVNTVPGSQTTNEDTALVFSSGNTNQISTSDVDAGAAGVQITLSVGHGTLTLAQTSGLSFTIGDGTSDATMVFTGTTTDVNSALNGLSYQPALNYNGGDSLSFTTNDEGHTGSGGAMSDASSVAITINAVNDPPVNSVPGPQSVDENSSLTFSGGNSNQISTSDVDAGSSPVQVSLAVSHGTLTLSGTSGLNFVTGDGTNDGSMVFTGTISDVNTALDGLVYTPGANFHGSDSLSFTTNDQGATGSGGPQSDTDSVAITVSQVNQPPVNTVPGAQTTKEDTALVFSSGNSNQISTSDPDAGTSPVKITLGVSNGTLTLAQTSGLSFTTGDGTNDASLVFTGSISDVNAALNGMSYQPGANFNGSDSLSFVTDDQGNTGSGGPKTDSSSVAITVNAVNDPPVNTVPDAQTTNEDTALVFSSSNNNVISTSDVDAGSNPVKVDLGVSNGKLTLSQTTGLSFTTGDGTSDASMEFTGSIADVNAALDGLSYLPNLNYNGSDSLSFTVNDQGHTGSGGPMSDLSSVAITINAVNDPPVNTVPGPQQVFTNGTLTFSSAGSDQISTSDFDAGSNPVEITLDATHGTMTLSGTSGLSFTTGTGTGDTSMVFTGSISDVNTALDGMTYSPDNGYTGDASVSITTNDQGNTGSGGPMTAGPDTVDITVINPPPVAANDDFSSTPAVGNTAFGVGTSPSSPSVTTSGSVLSNDSDPDGETISADAGTITSAHGGSVTLNSDGTFTYMPAPGFTGTDTFQYTVSDAHGTSSPATVTLLVQNMVWYVNDALGSNGNGESNSPFNSLSGVNAANGSGDADGPGDIIFLYSGSGGYDGGLPLEASQQLIGQPQGLVVAGHTLVAAGGTNPVITNTTSGGAGITLSGGAGNGNTIKRVDVQDASGPDVTGTNVDTLSYGANTNISNNSSGGGGVVLSGGGSGGISIGAAISTSAGHSVSVAGRTGGTTAFSGSINDTGSGISLSSNTGATINLSGGVVASTGANTAFSATGGGTVNVTGSSSTLDTTSGEGLNLSGTDAGASGINFAHIVSSSGGQVANIATSTGTKTLGQISTSSGSTTALNLSSAGTVNVGDATTAGSLTTSSANAVVINATALSLSGQGLNVTTTAGGRGVSDTGGTVAISGGNLGITTSAGSGAGFVATAGGTVSLTGSGNSIASGTGTALDVESTTIGASGLNFKSISANGGSHGVVLDTTGTSGGLTVSGTGSAGSGGSIQAIGGADLASHACGAVATPGGPVGVGIFMNATKNPSFTDMTLPGTFGNFGILGYGVNGFTLDHSTMTGTYGDNVSMDEAAVAFCNLTGSANITSDTIQNGALSNISVINVGGSLNRLTMTNDTVGLTNTSLNGSGGTLIEACIAATCSSATTMNTTVEDSTFQGSRGTPVAFVGQDNSTMDVVFGQPGHGNTVHNTFGANTAPGTEDFDLSPDQATFDVNSNHFDTPNTSNTQGGVFINAPDSHASMSGYFRNNTIGSSGVSNSGSDGQASALDIESNDGGDMTIDVDSNQIYQFNGALGTAGVWVIPHGATTAATEPTVFNMTFTNNTIAQQGTVNSAAPIQGFQLDNETTTGTITPNGEPFTTCLKFSGNTVNGSGGGGTGGDVRLRQRFDTKVDLPGYTGPQDGVTGTPTIASFIQGLNPTGPPSVTSTSSTSGGGGFFNTPGGAACALPGF
jgi:hypothetical protein